MKNADSFRARKVKAQYGPSHNTLLYVLGIMQDGPVKIGVTGSLGRRLYTLQCAHFDLLRPFGVRAVVRREPLFDRHIPLHIEMQEAGQALENYVHSCLMDMGLHLRGEWFDVTAQEALAAIYKTAQSNGFVSLSVEGALMDLPKSRQDLWDDRKEIAEQIIKAQSFIRRFNEENPEEVLDF